MCSMGTESINLSMLVNASIHPISTILSVGLHHRISWEMYLKQKTRILIKNITENMTQNTLGQTRSTSVWTSLMTQAQQTGPFPLETVFYHIFYWIPFNWQLANISYVIYFNFPTNGKDTHSISSNKMDSSPFLEACEESRSGTFLSNGS